MKTRKQMREIRKRRVRALVFGTAKRPRLAVFRSGGAMFVQLIDDERGKTLLSKRTVGKNIAAATALGKAIAKIAKEHKISHVVFDRSGYRYHGAIAALADAVRVGGVIV